MYVKVYHMEHTTIQLKGREREGDTQKGSEGNGYEISSSASLWECKTVLIPSCGWSRFIIMIRNALDTLAAAATAVVYVALTIYTEQERHQQPASTSGFQ